MLYLLKESWGGISKVCCIFQVEKWRQHSLTVYSSPNSHQKKKTPLFLCVGFFFCSLTAAKLWHLSVRLEPFDVLSEGTVGSLRRLLVQLGLFHLLHCALLWLKWAFAPSRQCLLPLATIWACSLTVFERACIAKQFFCIASAALLMDMSCPSFVFVEHRILYSRYHST